MGKYRVTFFYTLTTEVEAESSGEAEGIASEMLPMPEDGTRFADMVEFYENTEVEEIEEE